MVARRYARKGGYNEGDHCSTPNLRREQLLAGWKRGAEDEDEHDRNHAKEERPNTYEQRYRSRNDRNEEDR